MAFLNVHLEYIQETHSLNERNVLYFSSRVTIALQQLRGNSETLLCFNYEIKLQNPQKHCFLCAMDSRSDHSKSVLKHCIFNKSFPVVANSLMLICSLLN